MLIGNSNAYQTENSKPDRRPDYQICYRRLDYNHYNQ